MPPMLHVIAAFALLTVALPSAEADGHHCPILKPSSVLRPTDTLRRCLPFSIPPGIIPDVEIPPPPLP